MHRARLVLSTKPTWISALIINESNSYRGISRLPDLLAPSFLPTTQSARKIHLGNRTFATVTGELEPNFFSRIWSKISFLDTAKYQRKMTGYLLYEEIVHNIKYADFFEDLKMADTFYSWFVITELHVWMLMLRYMAEGKNGQDMRNNIVEAMWSDVNTRKTKLEKANVIALKKQAVEISKQFNAAIIGYDEGIMSDDKVLAGALWRRCYQCECNNPESLEKLVHYVRKQINILDKLPKQEILKMRSMPWLNYKKFDS